MKWLKRHKVVNMTPPDDQIFLCPTCGGTVEVMTFCNKHPGFVVHPCDDLLTRAQVREMTGIAL